MKKRTPATAPTNPNRRKALMVFTAGAAIVASAVVGINHYQQQQNSPADAAPVARAIPTWAELQQKAVGFQAGMEGSHFEAVIFFDPACPHCAMLWQQTQPIREQVSLKWVPVAFISPSSLAQGATILAADNPVAAMNIHEEFMRAQRGGITARGTDDSVKDSIRANTKLLEAFGAEAVPFVVGKKPVTGEIFTMTGASGWSLAESLGVVHGQPLALAPGN